ncbi:MAG: hypothetical protein IID32_11210 [Planctomycetes bacterium]|nr:hypothetical protein [Planctomycetota bacterium]
MGKIYFTKEELIKIAKKYKPKLKGKDLEHYALGGYVETKKGFIEFGMWKSISKSGATTISINVVHETKNLTI